MHTPLSLARLILIGLFALFSGCAKKTNVDQETAASIDDYSKALAAQNVRFARGDDIEIIIYRGNSELQYLTPDFVPQFGDKWIWRFGSIARDVPSSIKQNLLKATHSNFPQGVKQDIPILVEFLRTIAESLGIKVKPRRSTPWFL
ncbi:MAG: hypothetical protein PHV34_00255 [Verrucomicrobiae bacterium]|nr:hypothetical protein [Verrucomicrobiae bacterium]